MKAIVLAAGYATRLGKLTENFPKALLPIGGRPILDYLLEEMATLPELTDVYVVSNHKFFAFFEKWQKEIRDAGLFAPLHVHIVDDGSTSEENRLGALGDIAYTIDRMQLDDDLLVAAGDNFFTFPLKDFYDDFRTHGRDTLCATHVNDVNILKSFAVAEVDIRRRVIGLAEKPAMPKSDIAVYALYLYRRDTLPLFRQYLAQGNSKDAPGHFPEWLYMRKDVRAYLFSGQCYDIGTLKSYEEVCTLFANGKPVKKEKNKV